MKEIKLSQNKIALVDDEDYEELSKYTWCLSKTHDNFRAKTKIAGKQVLMHRLIMRVTDPKVQVDHINRDSLDNRKENLRLCNNSQNNINREKTSRNKTGYKGVVYFGVAKRNSIHKTRGKEYWHAQIAKDGVDIRLGYFDNPIDAALAYDRAAKELFGDFALTNF